MATTEPFLPSSDESFECETALDEAAAAIGPLRDPDGCVLLCPDCSCRRLIEERRASRDS